MDRKASASIQQHPSNLFTQLCKDYKSADDFKPLDYLKELKDHEEGFAILWMLNDSWKLIIINTFERSIKKAQICLDFIWEKLNTGYWKDVPLWWREAYYLASLIKALGLIGRQQPVADVLKTCDMGLLMGAPILDNILGKLGSVLNDSSRDINANNSDSVWQKNNIDQEVKVQNNTDIIPMKKQKLSEVSSVKFEIKRVSSPSLLDFQNIYMKDGKPIIITDSMNYWPAMNDRRWSLEYMKSIAGYRTVPIEIGDRYTSEDWTQKLITIKEFIETYIKNSHSVPKGYLAQHQLFDQVPELKSDILIPDYCCLSDDDSNGNVIINTWFGPEGTISPLHHDPYLNLLAQVVGSKYIRLYEEKDSDLVYPYTSFLLNNTSQVDVENPDLQKFPEFKDAPYFECILKEGEMLFIPAKCWHYVKSLSVSFSVSFWWK